MPQRAMDMRVPGDAGDAAARRILQIASRLWRDGACRMEAMVTGDLTAEQRELWERCGALWELSLAREAGPIRAALHPDYTGWVTGADRPHDREAAVAAVGPSSPRVLDYELTPLSVKVFDGRAGVVHYRYLARLEAGEGRPTTIGGRWTEVYLRSDEGAWTMIAVSGGPDGER